MTPTPDDDARFASDPALQALLQELQQDLVDEPETNGSENGGQLASALEHDMFSPETQRFVDQLLSHGENPSPELRQRLTRAAARGIDYQRKKQGPLPVLLAARREVLGMKAGELAADLGIEKAEIYDIESGKRSIRTLDAQTLVTWSQAVKAPTSDVVPALRRALELTRAGTGTIAAGRRGTTKLSPEDEDLVSKVRELLPD